MGSGNFLVSLLPADFVGGNVLIVGTDELDKNLLNAVGAQAARLFVIDDGEPTANFDGLQLNFNCEVERVNRDSIPSCSLVVCYGLLDAALASVCMSCLLPDGYVMLLTQCVQVDEYIRLAEWSRRVDHQVLYSSVFKKVLLDPGQDRRLDSLHDVLNDKTYTKKILRMMQKVFSRDGDPGYISTGGAEVTEECMKMLELQPGQRVLDVGCGAGGPVILTAKKYKAHVIGVDISANMIDAAMEATADLQDLKIELEVCDIERREFPEEYFDAIYSKDVILHIVRKQALFKKFLKWLKPGGKLLITDYCRTDNDFSDIMQDYMNKRANVWFLITQAAYGQHLKDAGFVNVDVQDKHAIFRECCVKENVHLANIRDELLKEFDKQFLDDWYDVWKKKVKLIDNKDMTWGVFYAEKSHNSDTC